MTNDDRLKVALELLKEKDVNTYGRICAIIEEIAANGEEVDIDSVVTTFF